jgi:large subunit ribosomal protein L3
MLTLYGKNLGMTQEFAENGDMVPVTVIQCGPCIVVQKKTVDKEGYCALQLGFDEIKKAQRVNRPRKGHFQKAKTPMFRRLGEYRADDLDDVNVGDSLSVELFQIGDLLNIRGKSKGRGFQGVIKRHNKSGGAASHGSHFHRTTGSIGMCADPAKVIKGMRMPGHMGSEFKTIKNLKVIAIDAENNLLFVKGAVPGAKNGFLKISQPKIKLGERLPKPSKQEDVPAETAEKVAEEVKESQEVENAKA